MAQQTADCKAISKSTYTNHEWGVGLLSTLIPFIGPALTPLVPSVPNMQSQLSQAQEDLKSATSEWRTTITQLLDAEIDLVTNFVQLVLGGESGDPGYIDTAIAYATQPLTEATIILRVNYTFLAIMLGIVVYYNIKNK